MASAFLDFFFKHYIFGDYLYTNYFQSSFGVINNSALSLSGPDEFVNAFAKEAMGASSESEY
jgi:hypothetical protein